MLIVSLGHFKDLQRVNLVPGDSSNVQDFGTGNPQASVTPEEIAAFMRINPGEDPFM
jgi:hypothetical protein